MPEKCPKCGKLIADCSCSVKDDTGPSVVSMPLTISAATINEQNKRFWKHDYGKDEGQ
jgi:hypothetical protein